MLSLQRGFTVSIFAKDVLCDCVAFLNSIYISSNLDKYNKG